MDTSPGLPVPVLSSTVEAPHFSSSTDGHITAAPPAAPTGNSFNTASRPPDAFAVSDTSRDPLLAGLYLAQERLAFYLSQSTDISLYHGGAVTSLVVPVEPPPPPPLRRDVVDRAEANSTEKDNTPQKSEGAKTAERKKTHVGEEDEEGERQHSHGKKKTSEKRRYSSRRQREHARRIEAALDPALVIEMRERLPAPSQSSPQPQDVVILNSNINANTSQSASTESNGHDVGEVSQSVSKKQSSEKKTRDNKGVDAGQQKKRRHHWRQLRERETEAQGQPASTENMDASQHETQRGKEDYRPDDDDASDFIEERMRLLQDEHGDDVSSSLLAGYSAYVRPAEHFQRGPVPMWMQHYSNWLLFDAHRVDDRHDTKMLKQMHTTDGALGRYDVHVQLPVDAVVLRLRGDIARARRLRDKLLKERVALQFLFPDTYAGRYEVYSPIEMDWTAATTTAAVRPSLENTNPQNSTNDAEVEMRAEVPPKMAETHAHHHPSSAENDDSAVVIVPVTAAGGSPHADHGDGNSSSGTSSMRLPQASARERRNNNSLLLSRDVEAKDLQRPLLAQTIPVWRRRGAAVKLLTELIEFLEDRLHAFGKQLDDPTYGPAFELIGAPDSSGVDGSVRATYPPALERALKTTITNTLLSDIFATPRSALRNRALRLSEALRRRQIPFVHDVYVTQLDYRPVYDCTTLCTTRSCVHAHSPNEIALEGGHARGEAAAAAAGLDTRKSYSVHVDYARFQPSLKNAAVNMLRKGYFANVSHATSPTAGGVGASSSSPLQSSARRPTLLSSSEEAFSSVLLGSYISVFFPREGQATAAADSANPPPPRDTKRADDDVRRRGSLGTDNVGSTTAALLLALSSATSQNALVSFSPEEYLISLLLRYYEQYRMLQLNLLPSLKNRFFYQEQLAQLQRQPRQTTELNKLQARLEKLAETSANVERGCLHVMIMLWNAVLEQRRRHRRSDLSGGHASLRDGGQHTMNQTTFDTSMHNIGMGEEEEEDPPIIIERRTSLATVPQDSQARRHGRRRPSASGDRGVVKQITQLPPPPMTSEEIRAHPPLFTDEEAGPTSIAAVVHSVNNTVTCNEVTGDNTRATTPAADKNRNSRKEAAATTLPMFFAPTSPDTRAMSASASPLLAPPSFIFSSDAGRNDHAHSATYNTRAGGGGADPAAQSQAQPLPCAATRFRFFLRRYGTTDEVPYVMGDDLLWYAAEVEGTDVMPTVKTKCARVGNAAQTSPSATPAVDISPEAARDELLYFQLVVFARSRAAMVPQYVGCTAPRPMTTTKVIFFNETFEVRALHEPAEILLHLIPVTSGPSKMTVVSTVRLRPTLTRRYALLPLQPPTAFMFHGKLFSRNSSIHSKKSNISSPPVGAGTNKSDGSVMSTLAASPLSGVLAVSATWTSSQGLSIAQMEQLFVRGVGGADPLDPQYLPILRTLRSYYAELDSARASNTTTKQNAEEEREKSKRRGRRHRRRAAVREPHSPFEERRLLTSAALGNSSGGRHTNNKNKNCGRRSSSTDPHHHSLLGRHASSVAFLRQRHASASLQRQMSTLGPSQLFNAAARRASSFAVPGTVGGSEGGVSLGLDSGRAALNIRSHVTPMMVLAAAAGAHSYAGEDAQLRLPTVRLQYLFRRWLIKIGRIKPVDEIESRLLERPIPLNDADTYLARKRVLRLVEKEQETRNAEYAASGGNFDAERYYKAPSAISGLALSNLPPETKLKLWQERQRRLLLTLKANRHVSDAEKLETIVKVPKLALKLVFDFAPRSQLNPHRKVRPKTEDIDRALLKRRQDSRIVVHIMKAHGLPYRADGTPLEPFMQARFVSEAAYTRSEVGSSPSWFETLELPFQPLDFEEDTLSMIDDDVVISLYDKVEVKMAPSAATTAAVAHETHYRTERRFIGALRIPFYSLHQASEARMEGVYPLQTPRWLLGYDLSNPSGDVCHNHNGNRNDHNSISRSSGYAAADGGALDEEETTKANPFGTVEYVSTTTAGEGASSSPISFPSDSAAAVVRATAATVATNSGFHEQQACEPTVQLYLSLWPPLQRDPPKKLSKTELHRSVNQLFVSPELHYLHRVALQWQQTALQRVKSIAAMNAQATTRQIDPFVKCSTGDLVLVCRYMLPRGGPPPSSVRTVYEAIRYVSLLPFVADMMTFAEKDVWSTNAELLAMRSGDYEELALLLVHFLRYLAPDRPTYAVVGSGSIYQQTIMVLHALDDNELYLIDPRSGWTVLAGKPYGTLLRDVYCVISHDQMWANTQMSGLPHRMTWDLHNPMHWLPCFDSMRDRRIPLCLQHLSPIQREVLDFPPADAVKSREIEIELRACLKRALLTWRNGCPPAYHRGVEAILRDLLEAAEEERCTCGSARRMDITQSAAARLSEYFGESVTGATLMSLQGEQQRDPDAKSRKREKRKKEKQAGQQKSTSHRKRPHIRHLESEEDEEGGNAGSRGVSPHAGNTSPPSSASALRVLGSPVMGSYNPSDPQFEELLQQVFEGAVHEVGTNEVSFAAGIYVKSYTGDVCAMWVFLVAICRG